MEKVRDPVCGMMIERAEAEGQATFKDTTYYFCSRSCRDAFEADPARYANEAPVDRTMESDRTASKERHEPRFTKTGPIVAPKFGSAGSGGAEYELLPEAHDDER